MDFNENLVRGTTTKGSDPSIDTLNGTIALEQNKGRLVAYDSQNRERTIVDIRGLTTIATDGKYKIRVGQASSDGRDGIWTASSGTDLKTEGI